MDIEDEDIGEYYEDVTDEPDQYEIDGECYYPDPVENSRYYLDIDEETLEDQELKTWYRIYQIREELRSLQKRRLQIHSKISKLTSNDKDNLKSLNEEADAINCRIRALNIESRNNTFYDEDGYHLDWKFISLSAKEKTDFKCSQCYVVLRNHSHLLHAHHIDRDKKNNDPSNLKPLCVICHSEQYRHDFMINKISQKDRRLIEYLRTKNDMSRDVHEAENEADIVAKIMLDLY
ncbi:HNH endonuclease signature motif containing protein [Thiohalophilus sp.]|uniref:HNH endonuclease signature motif containing protein n=1 Tax=Thiohalophilus sp. TaxID=3028392 RepID=UPI002ACDEA72|nr:HNH endonuclease signature motif containing protein [Thiohalophilus sp.]MDZ7662518.1 HNH endonuclease signature motif containing protein [Thiohalophilus sp.]